MEWDPDEGIKKNVQIVMKFLILKSWIFLLNGSWSSEIFVLKKVEFFSSTKVLLLFIKKAEFPDPDSGSGPHFN
jgi:hypothetical protein